MIVLPELWLEAEEAPVLEDGLVVEAELEEPEAVVGDWLDFRVKANIPTPNIIAAASAKNKFFI